MQDNSLKPYITTPENAERIAYWLLNHGGIAIWMSDDGLDRRETIAGPVYTSTGERESKPEWWVGDEPACIITDFADVIVSNDVEFKRLRVKVWKRKPRYRVRSAFRVSAAVREAGEGAYSVFDEETQQAVIIKPEWRVPLLDFLRAQYGSYPSGTAVESNGNPSTDSGQNVQTGLEEGDESSPTRLSREQLRNLLNDFLGQLTTSKPPTPANTDQQQSESATRPLDKREK
jgi:hypothetical protein